MVFWEQLAVALLSRLPASLVKKAGLIYLALFRIGFLNLLALTSPVHSGTIQFSP